MSTTTTPPKTIIVKYPASVVKRLNDVGRCYDILEFDPTAPTEDGSAKLEKVFDFSETDIKYIPGTGVKVPPTVKYMEGSESHTQSESTEMYTAYDYQEKFSLSYSTALDFGGLFSFSESKSFNKFEQTKRSRRSITEYNQAEIHTFTLGVEWTNDTPREDLPLDVEFSKAVTELPVTSNPEENEDYKNFILKYGTHFLQKASFGGRMWQYTEIEHETYMKLVENGIDVKAEAGASFKGITASTGLDLSTSQSKQYDEETKNSRSDIQAIGGIINTLIDEWAKTVPDNPAPITIHFKEIYELFTPHFFPGDSEIEEKRLAMKNAITSTIQNRGVHKTVNYRFTNEFERVWTDSDIGNEVSDGSFYKPVPDKILHNGYHIVGHVGLNTHKAIKDIKNITAGLLCPVNNIDGYGKPALAQPEGFDFIWNSKTTSAHYHGSFWLPKAPEGYVALGIVVNSHWDQIPDNDSIMCLRKDLATKGRVTDLIWRDRYSGAHDNISVWRVEPLETTEDDKKGVDMNMLYAHRSYEKPADDLAWVLKESAL